jgi:hypothetical protein
MKRLLEPMNGLPMQPVILGPDNKPRFQENRIVTALLDLRGTGPKRLDLNEIVKRYHEGEFTEAELNQFYMLIGYSVEGYRELGAAFYAVGDLAALEGEYLLEDIPRNVTHGEK